MFDSIHEECGVFGIRCATRQNVASAVYYALYALQHRGQESCGIAVNDKGLIKAHRDSGLVPDVFSQRVLVGLGEGTMAIGHTRYSALGGSARANAQPLVVKHIKGAMAISHNGSISNAGKLKHDFELNGAIFHTVSDSEIIAYSITYARLTENSIEEAIEKCMYKLEGAYSLVIMSPRKLIAVRDPNGFRPLCMGEAVDGSVIFASESCALETLGATFIRDIEPGEIVIADDDGVRSIRTHCNTKKPGLCVFELVYFARPDSVIDEVSVHATRKTAGRYLWEEHPVKADVVVGVPDSGLDAALGLSQASGIPYGVGLIKNRYIGRTFIQPTQVAREDAVRIKLNVLADTVRDKRVILVDDSIVRGTTSGSIVNLLRRAGAKEIHMRISCPPFRHPCYFGTDIDSRDKLIACRMSVSEIGQTIGVDSIGFLSVNAVNELASPKFKGFCSGCFTGEYPIEEPTAYPKARYDLEIPEPSDE